MVVPGGPAEFLELLVDGRVVTAAFLIRLEEGVIAYWPPEALDDEAAVTCDALSVPLKPGLYFVVGGDDLSTKYVGLVIGENVLLLRVSEDTPAETLAQGLSRTYMLFKGRGYGRKREAKHKRKRRADDNAPTIN